MKRDRLLLLAWVIIAAYALVALGVETGLIAASWNESYGPSYGGPSLSSPSLWFGTDLLGRSVLLKIMQGARISMVVGLISSLLGAFLGLTLGGLAGFFGRWVDDLVMWLCTTVASIPNILLLMAMSFAFGKGMLAVTLALGLTSWISLARVIRGEVMKQKEHDYVLAARSIGTSEFGALFKHILPNVSHFAALHVVVAFVASIRAEVILSFLGLGVQGAPSWGILLDEARSELSRGVWWQLAAASGAAFVIAMAFSVVQEKGSLRTARSRS